MDQPGLPAGDHFEALRGLGRINTMSRAAAVFGKPLREMALGRSADSPLRVLDVACGGGDTSIWLMRFARRTRLNLSVTGLDISPTALAFASKQADSAGVAVYWIQRNALEEGLPDGFDVILCSLFLHHLRVEQGTALLREMAERARMAVLLNDLVRSRPGLWLSQVVPRLLCRSYVVHNDAVSSVRAAFTIDEVRDMALAAGMRGATISRLWPERFLLSYRRDGPDSL